MGERDIARYKYNVSNPKKKKRVFLMKIIHLKRPKEEGLPGISSCREGTCISQTCLCGYKRRGMEIVVK